MKKRFADTSYYLAITNSRDQYHAAAKNLVTSFDGEIVTTQFVLTEVGDALSAPKDRP